MAAIYTGRWSTAVALASAGAVAAVAALVVLATPAFTEATESYVRVTLTGIVPALAILGVTTAMEASSRVLKAPWAAAILGLLGCIATSVTYELWYAGFDSAPSPAAPIIIAASGSVLLNGAALAVLVLPAFKQFSTGSTVAVLLPVVVFGGLTVLLTAYPMYLSLLVAAGAVTAVLLMRRADSRTIFAASA